MTAPLSLSDSFIAGVYAVIYVAAAVAVGIRLARRLTDERLERALFATLITIAQGVGLPLVFAMLGALHRAPILAAQLIILVIVYGRVPRADPSSSGPGSLETRVAASIGGVLTVLAAAPTLRAIASSEFESRHYHIANPAGWLRTHNLWSLPFQNPGFTTATHPGNGELLGLWLILPSHGDQIAYLRNLPIFLLAALACAVIARELGGSPALGAMAALALIAAPISFRTQAHALTTDAFVSATLAACVAVLLVASRRPGPWLTVLAGVALGLSLGSKYTALIPCAAILLWAAFGLRPPRRFWLLLPGLLLFAAPWFVRNAVTTGNPIFPQRIAVGSLELSGYETPLEVLDTPIADHFLHARGPVLRRWGELGWELYGPAGMLALTGIVAAFWPGHQRLRRAAVATLATACVLAYAITPYTGAGRAGLDFLMGSNLRYAMAAALLGVALLAAALPRRVSVLFIAGALAYDAYEIVRGTRLRPELHVIAPVGAVAILVALVVLAAPAIRPRLAGKGLFAAMIPLLVLATSALVWRVDRNLRPTPLEREIARVHGDGPVIVIEAFDLRSVLGPRLDTRMVTLSEGGAAAERPYATPAALNRALSRAPGQVLLTGRLPDRFRNLLPGWGVPFGWTAPPEWRLVAHFGATEVYVRRPGAS